jgi:copper chaperone
MHEFQVEGMSCNHCVSKVTRSIRKTDDAATVDVDLAAKKVRVQSSADPDELCAAITEAGYPARAANPA